jgi:hypothetical protein
MPDTREERAEGGGAPRGRGRLHAEGQVTVPFNPQLINTGSKLVLIDAATAS